MAEDAEEQRKQAFKDLKLATINLQRASQGLSATTVDSTNIFGAVFQDLKGPLGKLGDIGNKLGKFANLSSVQFVKQKLRDKFSFNRERKAAKLLAKEMGVSKARAKQIIKQQKMARAEEKRKEALDEVFKSVGVKLEEVNGTSKEQQDKDRQLQQSQVKRSQEQLKETKKGNKQSNENWKEQGLANKRLLLVTIASGLLRTAGGILGGALGAVAGVLGKFILPLIAALGLGGLGKIIVDKLLAWITGEKPPDWTQSLKELMNDPKLAAIYAGGGLLTYKAISAALRAGINRLILGPRNLRGVNVPVMKPRTVPRVGPTNVAANKLKEQQRLKKIADKAEAVRKASQAKAAARAAALTRALAPIIAFSQTARTKIAETVTKLKSVGARIGEETKKLAPKAARVGGKVLTRAGALGIAAMTGPFAPFLAAGVTLGFAVYDGINGWNNAAAILGKPEADIKFIDRINASGYAVASGLTFGLVSARTIAENFERAKIELEKRKANRSAIAEKITDLWSDAEASGTNDTMKIGQKTLNIVNQIKGDRAPVNTGLSAPQLRRIAVGAAGTKTDLETPINKATQERQDKQKITGFSLYTNLIKTIKLVSGTLDKSYKGEFRKRMMPMMKAGRVTDESGAAEINAVINEILATGILPLSVYNKFKEQIMSKGIPTGGTTIVDYKTNAQNIRTYNIGAHGMTAGPSLGSTLPKAR